MENFNKIKKLFDKIFHVLPIVDKIIHKLTLETSNFFTFINNLPTIYPRLPVDIRTVVLHSNSC
jgi:hypothetical protein